MKDVETAEGPETRPGVDALVREALSVSPTHFAVYDPDERLVAWSAGFERFHAEVFAELRAEGRLADVTAEELIRRQVRLRFPPERREREVADRLASHRAADGTQADRFVPGVGWARLRKIRTPSGGVVTLGEDVTALKREEAAREAARAEAERANAAKTAFLANVSHELRTPLNGVTGLAALLDATSLDPTQREHLRLIRESAGALLGLIEELLEVGRIESGRIALEARPFSPAALLSDVCDAASAAARTGLSVDCSAGPAVPETIVGDPERFRQIAWNLVGNAVKFARAAVAVKLDAEATSAGLRLRLAVEDDGPGVPEHERDAVFERFRSATSPENGAGAGLGLAISRALALRMGGAIGVGRSSLGGARFWVEMPVDPPPLDVGKALD